MSDDRKLTEKEKAALSDIAASGALFYLSAKRQGMSELEAAAYVATKVALLTIEALESQYKKAQ